MIILSILLALLLIGGKILPPILINRIIILSLGYAMIFIIILIKIIDMKELIQSIQIYNNLYQITKIELFVKTLIYFGAFIISFLGEITKNKGNILKSAEYNILTFLSILGMITLIESNDIISIFLSMELTSFPLYILASLYNFNTSGLGINKDSQSGIKAGLKYLLLGSFTSTMLLGGLIILYGIVGLTNLNEIGICINIGISAEYTILGIFMLLIIRIVITGFILTLSGLLFKIGSVPFHNWAPDVYDGMPTIVTSWVSILPKISFITIMGTLNTLIFKYINKSNFIFILTSFGSLIIGSIVGLSQYRIKRLLTYSSITQIGFILLGYSIKESSSLMSILFYLIQYTLTSICVFLILMSLYKFFNIEVISQFKNLFNFNSLLSFSLMICFFSFAGVPPFVGFFGKLNILKQSIHFGYYFLALIAVITSIISAGYYLRIIKISHFDLTSVKFSSNMKVFVQNITGNITINNFISILTIFIIFYILLYNINSNLYNYTLIC